MATSSTRRSLRFGPAPTREPRRAAIWVLWVPVGPSWRALEILPPTPTLPRKGGGSGARRRLRIGERTNSGDTRADRGGGGHDVHRDIKL